jgi:hypothetical protein
MYEQLLKRTGKVKMVREGLKDIRKKYLEGGLVPEEIYKKYEEGDFTPKKKYLLWMLKQYVRDSSRPEHILDVVRGFDRMVRRRLIENPDIYQFRTYDEVDQAISAAEEKEEEKGQKKLSKEGDTEVIMDNPDFLIIVPNTHSAAKPWGQGADPSSSGAYQGGRKAKWCITGQKGHWDSYFRRGDKFYFIIDKKTNVKWCIQVSPDGRKTAWDQRDSSMRFEEWEKKVKWKQRIAKYEK